MMKKIALLACIICCQQQVKAQDLAAYNFRKFFLVGEGYSITKEMECEMEQGKTCTFSRKFKSGYEYKIIGFAEDRDILDLDIVARYADGSEKLYKQDTGDDTEPYIIFTPVNDVTLEIVLKNIKSKYPSLKQKCYFIIGYK